MKKFLFTSFFVVSVIFAYSVNHVEAYSEKYVGTWESGYQAYLLMDTISGDYRDYHCTVKAIKGDSTEYIDYHFYYKRGEWRFKNSYGVDDPAR